MKKQLIGIFALAVLLVIPTSSQAATPDLQTLTQQLQTLTAQFESLKMRGDMGPKDKTGSSTPKEKIGTSTVDRTCMATAVAVRETSVATAWTTFSTKMLTNLTNRKNSLVAAWNIADTTARNQALTTAWKTWKTAKKSAHEQLKSSRKAAWDTFKATAKASCKVEVPKQEGLEKTSADSISL